jgi:hypothetical protein
VREYKDKRIYIYHKHIKMQEFNIDDLEPINIRFSDDIQNNSTNFGTGAELLMNDKKRSSSYSNTNIDLGELDKLEEELNELSNNNQSSNNGNTKTLRGFASNLFNFGSKTEENNDSKLGTATANSVSGVTKSFDGFSKMNDVPVNFSSNPTTSEREKRRKKRMMIRKLEEWQQSGKVKNISNFNIDSVFEEVEDEYESALEDKRKSDSIKVQGQLFMTFIHTIEYSNAYFDPFDVNLDGWGEQINENLDSYDEIFTELYQKYKGGKISPEISLLLRLGFSASVVNFTNKALSSATPGFNDVMKQSPELMKMFTKATVDAMSQQSPGFNFANTMLHKDEPNNTTYGPPPVAVETKLQPPSQRPMNNMQFTQRPDIVAGRGNNTMFREQGIDINNNQENSNFQERRNINTHRQEMKGPQNIDIDTLLSGLKVNQVIDENDSLISTASMRDMMKQPSLKPKRSYRKTSEKNTISLDI